MDGNDVGLDGCALPDCPFCGGRPVSRQLGFLLALGTSGEADDPVMPLNHWQVNCTQCGARVEAEQTVDDGRTENDVRMEAEAKWRRRA